MTSMKRRYCDVKEKYIKLAKDDQWPDCYTWIWRHQINVKKNCFDLIVQKNEQIWGCQAWKKEPHQFTNSIVPESAVAAISSCSHICSCFMPLCAAFVSSTSFFFFFFDVFWLLWWLNYVCVYVCLVWWVDVKLDCSWFEELCFVLCVGCWFIRIVMPTAIFLFFR